MTSNDYTRRRMIRTAAATAAAVGLAGCGQPEDGANETGPGTDGEADEEGLGAGTPTEDGGGAVGDETEEDGVMGTETEEDGVMGNETEEDGVMGNETEEV